MQYTAKLCFVSRNLSSFRWRRPQTPDRGNAFVPRSGSAPRFRFRPSVAQTPQGKLLPMGLVRRPISFMTKSTSYHDWSNVARTLGKFWNLNLKNMANVTSQHQLLSVLGLYWALQLTYKSTLLLNDSSAIISIHRQHSSLRHLPHFWLWIYTILTAAMRNCGYLQWHCGYPQFELWIYCGYP